MGPTFWEGIKLDASVWWFLRDIPVSPENTAFFGLIISWPLVFCFKTYSTWKIVGISVPARWILFKAQQFVRPQRGGGWIWQRFSWRKFRKNCFRQTFRRDLYIYIYVSIYTHHIYYILSSLLSALQSRYLCYVFKWLYSLYSTNEGIIHSSWVTSPKTTRAAFHGGCCQAASQFRGPRDV